MEIEDGNKLDFSSIGIENYNVPLTMRNLRTALSLHGNSTSPGSEGIPDIMLRHVSFEFLLLFLDIHNIICRDGFISAT